MSVDIDSFVRLMPMPKPTFGRASYKTFHTFVPIQEIWDAFEPFMAKKAFTHGNGVYVPTQVPYVNQTALTLQVLKGAIVSVYKESGTTNKTLTLQTTQAGWNTGMTAFKSLSIVSSNMYSTELNMFNAALSEDNEVTPEGADFTYEVLSGSDYYLLCFKLETAKKRLRKILIGLGYQLQLMNGSQLNKISILPLVAYYKAYFDMFAPQRDITWKQTKCYVLMENVESYNRSDIVSEYITNSNSVGREMWYSFIEELENAWYTDNVDYFSAHITTPEIGSAQIWSTQSVSGNTVQAITQGSNQQPATSGIITQAGLNVLKKMFYWANKNTVIGGKVAEYLRAHFGSDVLDDRKSNFIGNSNINIQISDLYSQS